MPRKGDRVSYHGHSFVVADADERKVSRIEIERAAASSSESSGPHGAATLADAGVETAEDAERRRERADEDSDRES